MIQAVQAYQQLLKPGAHFTVMVPAVPEVVSNAEYDYSTCVLSQVPQADFNLFFFFPFYSQGKAIS